MTKTTLNPDSSKTKGRVILEYILLALCLSVIALRTMITESPTNPSTNMPINITSSLHSLSISTVLFLAFIIWLVLSVCSKRFSYRLTGMETGLYIFIIAAVIAFFAASDKRAAITSLTIFFAPLLCAVLLVQLLDSPSKIKLLFVVIAALGVVTAHQAANQFFSGNQIRIEQYEHLPAAMLVQLGIRPGTLAHMLFEHRLYSKDVSAFFTTSNSASSFSILAVFAAVALFIDKLKNHKSAQSKPLTLFICAAATAFIIFGLIIMRSKGAIAATLIAAAMFTAYLLFGNWLRTHRKAILTICLLVTVIVGGSVLWYGLIHDRLPGGNSMLVRWQYWRASAQMYADHWLTGLGPGNFGDSYTHYKPAAAPETVSDPHNFLLTILTQYGPLGLVGFLALVLVPLYKIVFSSAEESSLKTNHSGPAFGKFAVYMLLGISVALLAARPLFISFPPSYTLPVFGYMIFSLFLTPLIAFAVGFWFLTADSYATQNPQPETLDTNIFTAALLCAVIGILIHNLIDFAIFEPGVFTAFWAAIACLIALDFQQNKRKQIILSSARPAKILTAFVGLILIWACLNYTLIPVAKATGKIRRANKAVLHARFEQAHNLLSAAAEDDPLSAAALSLNGRLYLQRSLSYSPKQNEFLLNAEKYLLGAIERNDADFRNFERLTDAYVLLSEYSPQTKTDWLNKAFDRCTHAVNRYRGCGRLRVKSAKIAEQLNKPQYALDQYKKAIDIEDAYRSQFRLMYPSQEMFSRLGEGKYQFAKQRIKQLSEQQIKKPQ